MAGLDGERSELRRCEWRTTLRWEDFEFSGEMDSTRMGLYVYRERE